MAEQNYVYVDTNYLKELEETAKKADYYKGIIDGINMVIDRKIEGQTESQTEGIWNAGYKTGYDKGYKDAQKVKDSQG